MRESTTEGERWLELFPDLNVTAQDEWDYENPPSLVGTGIDRLDAVLSGGLAPGVHVLMALPGSGKSALALQIAMSAARDGGKVLYVSVEMSRQQCIARCCSSLSVAPGSGLVPFPWSAWEGMGAALARSQARDRAGDAGVMALRALHGACPYLTFGEGDGFEDVGKLAGTVRRASDAGLRLLVVDYMQRLRPSAPDAGADAYQRATAVSNALTSVTKEVGVPALVISSMGREAMRSGKPTLTGARGSGDIEYDALSVIQLTARDTGRAVRPVDLHVLKNRRGPLTGDDPIGMLFDGAHNRFETCR